MNISSLIDYCLLKPTITIAEIDQLCKEANSHHFRAVCVPPLFVKKVKELLSGSTVKLSTVVGFPFGYSAIEAKLAETVLAIVDGATEIEFVVNIAAIKNADWQYLAKEINTVLPIIKSKNIMIKVILETGILTEIEIITCCDIYGAAGVDIVKTSTGYAAEGATVNTVKLLRKHLADAVKITAAGFDNTNELAAQLISAGADFISSTYSVELVKTATP